MCIRDSDPDKGFRLATYAMWWIRASIQEYILRSWSLVKMGTTAAQKKLFFNLRKAKSEIAALQEGDLRPEQVSLIATKLGVLDEEVVSMNRRLSGGDASLNAPMRADGESEWQDWLVDTDTPSQETVIADTQEKSLRMSLLEAAMTATWSGCRSPSSMALIADLALRRLKNSFFCAAVVPILTSDQVRRMYSWIDALIHHTA